MDHSGRHESHKFKNTDELYSAWKDPDRWEEALDHLSPEQLRKGIRAVAQEEARMPRKRDLPEAHHLPRAEEQATARLREEYVDRRLPRRIQEPQARFEQEPEPPVQGYISGESFDDWLRREEGQPRLRRETEEQPRDDRTPRQRPEPAFYGINGPIKLGFTDDGSFNVGLDLGPLVRAGVKVGLENQVYAGAGPKELGANAAVGFGVNRDGLHADVGADVNAIDMVGGKAKFGVNAGPESYVDGDVAGKVGPFHVDSSAGADVGQNGLGARYGANTGISDVADVHTGGHFRVNENSSVGAGAGANVGPLGFDVGGGVDTDGNKDIRPHAEVKGNAGGERGKLGLGVQLGPDLDADVYGGYATEHANGYGEEGEGSFGVGRNRIGFRSNRVPTRRVD